MMRKKMWKKMKKKTMSGDFADLYKRQQGFQLMVTGNETPTDSCYEFCYHMNAMQEELGEVLKADKRWKTHRNAHYDRDEKLEELADVAITLMNLVMYSGFGSETFIDAIGRKISKNTENYKKAGHNNDSNS